MKRKLLVLIFMVLTFEIKAQLKDENFLFVNSDTARIKTLKIYKGSKGFYILNSKFKYENDINFQFYPYGLEYCCNYYEVKNIPKEWNIIGIKDIVSHLEDKSTGFSLMKKKLFFVEYDNERKIYKAFQVDIMGWPRPD